MPRGESSWLRIGVQRTPCSTRRSRYSSICSGGTSKATWFIEATAVVSSAAGSKKVSGSGEETPWWGGGASGNQKKARLAPLPMSKKKCWPRPPGSSMVLISGKPSTWV